MNFASFVRFFEMLLVMIFFFSMKRVFFLFKLFCFMHFYLLQITFVGSEYKIMYKYISKGINQQQEKQNIDNIQI